MTTPLLTASDVRSLLRQECAAAGGQSAWARDKGFTQAVVNKTVCGLLSPSKRLCKTLGLEIVVLYRRKGP